MTTFFLTSLIKWKKKLNYTELNPICVPLLEQYIGFIGKVMRALEGDIGLLVSVTAIHSQLEHLGCVGNTWTITYNIYFI